MNAMVVPFGAIDARLEAIKIIEDLKKGSNP
jgi:hypothetical protein